MAETTITNEKRSTRKWPKRLGISVLVAGALGWVIFAIAQYRADGPLNDIIPGGELRSGELVTNVITDWSFAQGQTIEMQLLEPMKSRWVGLMTYNNELYIPCDLGYMWGRFEGSGRHMLHLIYRFKRWHNDAVNDGRMVVRLDNKRYAFNSTLVTDADEIKGLKTTLEELAREWVAPDTLGPPPTEGPRDIWFFKLTQRDV